MKKPEYYAGKREDILEVLPDGLDRVLDIGCGAGILGSDIKAKTGGKAEITGVEIEEEIAKKAKAKIDRVLVGDIEKLELPFEKEYFDCVIYGDILEHLRDPWALLLKNTPFLKKSGFVIISVPNISHYRIIKMLFRKEWNYDERGILDREHLRFFTLKSAKDMLERANLDIVKIKHNISASKVKKFLNVIFFGALLDYITEQYIIVAKRR